MTPTELRQLFEELLEVDDVTVEDNFFDLGGSSVLALRLLLEIDKRWGITLSLIGR
jgi:acyl carrier protein